MNPPVKKPSAKPSDKWMLNISSSTMISSNTPKTNTRVKIFYFIWIISLYNNFLSLDKKLI